MDRFNTAVILAGGRSERMGFDKQFLKINRNNLVKMTISKLRKEFSEIIVVTNKPESYIGLCNKIVSDEIKGMGPLSGIHVGLKESTSKYAYFLACDMPNVNLEYIRFMKSRLVDEEYDACITKIQNWIEPFNAFYSTGIVQNIEQHLLSNRKSIYSLIENLNALYIEEKHARKYSPNWDMFSNLNTKEDLENYLNNIK